MDKNLVEIKSDDYFIVDMMYASLKNNMTGVAVYEEIGLGNRAFVHRDLWERLQQVIPYLKGHKLKLKIGDAYRPPLAHKRLKEIIPQPGFYRPPLAHKRLKEIIPQPGFFAASPERSQHCRGTAVDVCLCDEQGVELEYPTKMDAFDANYAKEVQSGQTEGFLKYLPKAHHDYADAETPAIKNCRNSGDKKPPRAKTADGKYWLIKHQPRMVALQSTRRQQR